MSQWLTLFGLTAAAAVVAFFSKGAMKILFILVTGGLAVWTIVRYQSFSGNATSSANSTSSTNTTGSSVGAAIQAANAMIE